MAKKNSNNAKDKQYYICKIKLGQNNKNIKEKRLNNSKNAKTIITKRKVKNKIRSNYKKLFF